VSPSTVPQHPPDSHPCKHYTGDWNPFIFPVKTCDCVEPPGEEQVTLVRNPDPRAPRLLLWQQGGDRIARLYRRNTSRGRLLLQQAASSAGWDALWRWLTPPAVEREG
jgi:hypothetical protein